MVVCLYMWALWWTDDLSRVYPDFALWHWDRLQNIIEGWGKGGNMQAFGNGMVIYPTSWHFRCFTVYLHQQMSFYWFDTALMVEKDVMKGFLYKVCYGERFPSNVLNFICLIVAVKSFFFVFTECIHRSQIQRHNSIQIYLTCWRSICSL